MTALLFTAMPGIAKFEAQKLNVAVSVAPQAYLVNRIGGNRVEVEILVPPGVAPATHEPRPQQMIALEEARLYVKVGHPNFLFEQRFLHPFLRRQGTVQVVDMFQGLASQAQEAPQTQSPAHLDEAKGDPHVWLAPDAMEIAARNIEEALSRLDPSGAAYYRSNLESLLADVGRLDREISGRLQGLKQRRFRVNHPAWGYFARHYGLEQVAIEIEGKEPTARQLVKLIEEARQEGCKVVFVQKGFADRSARTLAREIGADVVELDPLAYDWIENLRRVAQHLSAALGS